MSIIQLTKKDIQFIHNKLAEDATKSGDPIAPPGVKSLPLLESSVGIQTTGYSGQFKYNKPIDCCAALTYSLVSNHPFHNGNKRAALVSMIAHLDKNNIMLKPKVTQDHLFCLFVSCASHQLPNFLKCHNIEELKKLKHEIEKFKKEGADYKVGLANMDREVSMISKWLDNNTRVMEQNDKKLTPVQLNKCLKNYHYKCSPKAGNEFTVEKRVGKLIKYYEEIGTFRPRSFKDGKIDKKSIRKLREQLNLTEYNGVDSRSFYKDGDIVIDDFISKYRNVLTKLSYY